MFGRNLQRTFRFPKEFQQFRYQQSQTKLKVSPILNGKGPVFKNVPLHAEKVALKDSVGSYTYANLFLSANELSKEITGLVNGKTNERVLFLCPNDANYVITLWAIWMSGQIAVPLSSQHPKNILLYYANDTKSKLLITTPNYADLMQRVSKNAHCQLHVLDDKLSRFIIYGLKLRTSQKLTEASDLEGGQSNEFYEKNNALILYTSGTTGQPKGVVLSHRNINAQVNTLVEAWKWTPTDVILHTLPLHHVHGTVNALLCPLHVGAKTIMLETFNANVVWSHLLGINTKPDDRKITLFMAVPTIYSKLIDEYDKVFKNDSKMVEYIRNSLKSKMRLMVSGSAPLPKPIFDKWLDISGHKLLERYGMTEIGMCLSNSYDGEREPGYVGMPLPGVSVRVIDEESKTVLECTNKNGNISLNTIGSVKGELLVKSDGIFKEYYNRPQATRDEFTEDGWFKTGDMVEFDQSKNRFKMLGRKSVDIIKSGGYKLSALEIETKLMANSDITDCAVVALPDEEWGEKVVAIVVGNQNTELNETSIKEFLSDKLPKYAIPKVFKFVDAVPKNAMGKVNKKELVKNLFSV